MKTKPLDGTSQAALKQEYIELIDATLEPIKDGSGQARGEGAKAGWINGLSMTRLVTADEFTLHKFPNLLAAVMNFIGDNYLIQLMINKMNAGATLGTHRDGRGNWERWHLPIITNPNVTYWQESLDKPLHMQEGSWYGPIEYWTLHNMLNEDSQAYRVHAIVDIDRSQRKAY